MKELNIQKKILLRASKLGYRLFRNNTAQGWAGEVVKKTRDSEGNNFIIMKNPYPLRAGLFKGSSDLIGWRTIKITPDMVGNDIAVFTSVEVKTKEGCATKEQKLWLNIIKKSGGIAKIARDENDIGE